MNGEMNEEVNEETNKQIDKQTKTTNKLQISQFTTQTTHWLRFALYVACHWLGLFVVEFVLNSEEQQESNLHSSITSLIMTNQHHVIAIMVTYHH